MSKTGSLVLALQEQDDSFDGQGWIGEVISLNTLNTINTRKAHEHRNNDFGSVWNWKNNKLEDVKSTRCDANSGS